jgi:DNA-binding SARP family transcriptional activator/tetratricopeptide (TPR) repeat protein
LLGVLLLEMNRSVSVDRLAELLWDGDPPERARQTIHSHISRLRVMLSTAGAHTVGELITVGDSYRIEGDPQTVDAHRFRTLLGNAEQATDLAARIDRQRAALDLWRGPPLDNAASDWLRDRICSDLQELYLTAIEDAATASLALRREREILPELARISRTHPGRESLIGLHMQALYQAGRKVDALTAYDHARSHLADKLGLDPSPALRELHLAILRDQLTVPAMPAPTPAAPRMTTAAAVGSAPATVPRQLPANVPGFTGRATHLAQLDALLPDADSATTPAVVFAIDGTAGVGKTALAITWAHQVANRFPDGQLYVDLRGYSPGVPLTPIEVLAGFLHALGLRGADIPSVVDQAAAAYRSLLADKRMLVVLDNAHDADQVRPLLPAGPGCVALVTSRDQLGGLVARDGAQWIGLDVLPATEAHALLVRVLGTARVQAEPGAAAELARLCGYLPLALRIAAANLATRPRQRIADYVAQLRGRDLLALLAVGGDPRSAVAAAFDHSYARLPGSARRMFRLLGLVPGPDITADAAAALAGLTSSQAAQLLSTLARAHLIEEPVDGRYACHDLLRRYAADRTAEEEAEPAREAARQRLLSWYLQATQTAATILHPHMPRLPDTNPPAEGVPPVPFDGPDGALAWLEAERANLVAAITFAAEHGPRPMAWRLTHCLRGFWWQGGYYTVDGLAAANAALTAATSEADLTGQASARLILGVAGADRGSHTEAMEQFEAAAMLAQQADWADGHASALGYSALIHARQGRLHRAAARLAEAREIERTIGRPGALATTSNVLGGIYQDLGELARAAECFTESLDSYRQLGASETAYVIPLSNLAGAVHELGRLREALNHVTRALSMSRENGHRPGEAVALVTLATVHRDAGRYPEALDAAQTAVRLASDIGFRTAEGAAHTTLGTIHRCLDHPRQAIDHHQQALDLARQSSERVTEFDALLGLALAYCDLGDYDRAEEHARHVLDAARSRGYQHYHGCALTTLAEIRLDRHDHDRAREYAELALDNHRRTGHRLGEARTHLILGQISQRTEESGSARDHWRQAYTIFTDIGSPEAEQTAALLSP